MSVTALPKSDHPSLFCVLFFHTRTHPTPAHSPSKFFSSDDQNLEPYNATPPNWHPRFKDIVYHGMDWLCPGYTIPLAARIKANYGQLTPATIITDIAAHVQTGDVHAAVYDLTEQQLYVSFMARTGETDKPEMAYDRPWTQLDLASLFSLPPP